MPTNRFKAITTDVNEIMKKAHRSTGPELQQLYRQLAKRADQRLVRLEKLMQQEGFEDVKEYAYRKAMKDLHAMFGENALRFNRSTKGLSRRQLQARINVVAEFLSAASSTKSGIIEVYEKRAQTLNKNTDSNFTWQEYAKMFEMSDKLSEQGIKGGSGTLMRAIGAVYRMRNDKQAIEQANKGTYVFAKDPVVNDLAQRLWGTL